MWPVSAGRKISKNLATRTLIDSIYRHIYKQETAAPGAQPVQSSVDDLKSHTPSCVVRGSGGIVWPAARVLSRFIASGEASVIGARVLELGAGTHALPGLSAAASGAADVVVTDLVGVVEHHAAAFAANAGVLSLSACRLRSQAFPFGSKWKRLSQTTFDVVLLADVLSLDESLFKPLRKTLVDAALANSRVIIFIAARSRASWEQLFWEGLESDGWLLETRRCEPCEDSDGCAGDENVHVVAATWRGDNVGGSNCDDG